MSDAPVRFEVKWKAKKNLARLTLRERDYLHAAAPLMAGKIRTRTLGGQNFRGEAMSPLGFFYAKRKRKKGLSPIRDGRASGQMWRSLTAEFDRKDRFRLRFAGYRTSGIRNQRVADLLAGAPRRSRESWQQAAPAASSGPPHNAFVDANSADIDFLMRMYDKMVIVRAIRELPEDLSL